MKKRVVEINQTKNKNFSKEEKKMKKSIAVLMIVGLMTAGSAFAQNTNTVTVDIEYIANISVSGDVDFTLSDDGSGGYTVTPGTDTATLSYRHNGASNKRITGDVTSISGPTGASTSAGYNITCVASGVSGGSAAATATLVASGADNGAQNLITGIGAVGTGSATLTYDVTGATLANTVVTDADDQIVYTVTYTLTN